MNDYAEGTKIPQNQAVEAGCSLAEIQKKYTAKTGPGWAPWWFPSR